MNWSVFYGILIPFLGTSFGAACVFFMKKEMGDRLQRMLTGCLLYTSDAADEL